jgi:hypothetical protein
VQASSGAHHTSRNEVSFKDSFADLETLETDLNPRAPKNGADGKSRLDEASPEPPVFTPAVRHSKVNPEVAPPTLTPAGFSLEEVITRLKAELEPTIHNAARQAATREHERTREWLEHRGLPKAARVAQHEAYNVLRKYGVISENTRSGRAHAEVGRNASAVSLPRLLSREEIADMAGGCVALLETRGQPVELTLSEMSTEAGGFLLPEDACRVREQVNALLLVGKSKEEN